MTTATTETLEQEYDRLMATHGAIRSAARAVGGMNPELRQQLRPIRARLAEIDATPPVGYQTPKAVTDLVDHAKSHGWLAQVQWTPPGQQSEPSLRVQVGRKLTATEAAECRSDTYLYQLTWNSRDCPAGKVKRFGTGLAQTPDQPQWHTAPSMKVIRAVIEQHPAPNLPAA